MNIDDDNEQQVDVIYRAFEAYNHYLFCFTTTILGGERVLPEPNRVNFLEQMTAAFDALRRLVTIYESDNGELLDAEKSCRLSQLLDMLRDYIQRLDIGFELFLLMSYRQLHFSPGDLQPHCAQFFVLDRDTLNISGDLFDASDHQEHDRGVMEFKEKLVVLVRGLFAGLNWQWRCRMRVGRGRGRLEYRMRLFREVTHCLEKEEAILTAGTEFLQAIQGLTTTVHNVIEELAVNGNEPGWIPGRGDYFYANQEPRNGNNRQF